MVTTVIVLDTIKKRTQGDVTSVEDDVIAAIKNYKLTYDKASTALMYQEVTKVACTQRRRKTRLHQQTQRRTFNQIKGIVYCPFRYCGA